MTTLFQGTFRRTLAIAAMTVAVFTFDRFSLADEDSEFLSEVKSILRNRCLECHSDEASSTDFSVLDVKSMIDAKAVIPGEPDDSKLYTLLTTEDVAIRMPQDLPPLPSIEIEKIRKWIAKGAKEFPKDVEQPKEEKKDSGLSEVVGVEFVLKAILNHQRSLPANSQKFYRYFSSNHLLTRGATRDELDIQRDALVKTINHLTYERELVSVETIDGESASVFGVDIRKLGWHRPLQQPVGPSIMGKQSLNAYDLILLEYPYAIVYDDSETFDKISNEFLNPAGFLRPIPYLRIDWFCSSSLQPVLYHDIMRMPSDVSELERDIIGIDAESELEHRKVSRGAVILSGVSRNNRAAERYATPHGAYWKSIDYATNKGNENIFRDPIHLSGVGGEMIFNLPNGLQGYYLANAAGRRIDAGPTEIVTDKFSEDKIVRNAISCLRCHDQGIKAYKDVVRPSVEKLPGNLGFSKKEVLELYPPQSDFAALLRSDGDRFMKAMEKALGHEQKVEPLTPVTRRFLEDPLSLTTVAGELGLNQPGDLASVFRSRQFAALGMVPLASHGAVRRDTWEDYFDQTVRELGLGLPIVPIDSLTRLDYAPLGHGPNLEISTSRGSKVLAPGDEIYILLSNRGKSAVFIELVGTGTKGEKVVLIPAGTQIAPGSQVRFPEKNPIKVKPSLGQEIITVFASESRFEPGVIFRGKNTSDRLVHTLPNEGEPPLIKRSLIIETR